MLAANHYSSFYFSAFTERQMLLERYTYSIGYFLDGGRRYVPQRLLADGIAAGDLDAVRKARDVYGVHYVLIDKRDGFYRPTLDRSAVNLIYTNEEMDIYRVTP